MKAIRTIVIVAVFIWLGDALYKKLYLYSEKKPFWKETELVQVCKHPYYSSDDCSRMNVTLFDSDTVSIKFPDGETKISTNLTCYLAARSLLNEPRYVFCRSWDEDNQQWDFMPAWVHWLSIEDLSRSIEKYK